MAVEPWAAAGPGWANSGVTAIWEETHSDGKVKTQKETVYRDDLTAEEIVAWQAAMIGLGVLRRRFQDGGFDNA